MRGIHDGGVTETPDLPAEPAGLRETDRTRLRRHPERGTFDRRAAETILDEAYVAHVGLATDAGPLVLPMTYGRAGDALYLHGAVGNALLRGGAAAPVCVTVTLLDGLVLARSAYHHSMNYRSVVLVGEAVKVTEEGEKRRALDAIVDHVVPGRAAEARPASDGELRATLVLRLAIDEGSVKVRTGGPVDEPEDLGLDVWAGVVPLRCVAGEPIQDDEQVEAVPGLPAPGSDRFRR